MFLVIVAFRQGKRCAGIASAFAACLGLLSVSACYSPTLPLPPPDRPDSADINATGTAVTVDGAGVYPGALVFLFNTELGEGVITTGTWNRRYHADVPLDFSTYPRNTIEIWQRAGVEDSSSIAVYCDRTRCQ